MAKEEWIFYWTEFEFKIYLNSESKNTHPESALWLCGPLLLSLSFGSESNSLLFQQLWELCLLLWAGSLIYHFSCNQQSVVRGLREISYSSQDKFSSYCCQSNCILPNWIGSYLRRFWPTTAWCPLLVRPDCCLLW